MYAHSTIVVTQVVLMAAVMVGNAKAVRQYLQGDDEAKIRRQNMRLKVVHTHPTGNTERWAGLE